LGGVGVGGKQRRAGASLLNIRDNLREILRPRKKGAVIEKDQIKKWHKESWGGRRGATLNRNGIGTGCSVLWCGWGQGAVYKE